jgi:hypothetical protein
MVSCRGQNSVTSAAARASMHDDFGTGSRGRKNVVAITMRVVQLRDGYGLGDHLYPGCGFKTDRSDVMMTIMVRRRLLDADNAVIHESSCSLAANFILY